MPYSPIQNAEVRLNTRTNSLNRKYFTHIRLIKRFNQSSHQLLCYKLFGARFANIWLSIQLPIPVLVGSLSFKLRVRGWRPGHHTLSRSESNRAVSSLNEPSTNAARGDGDKNQSYQTTHGAYGTVNKVSQPSAAGRSSSGDQHERFTSDTEWPLFYHLKPCDKTDHTFIINNKLLFIAVVINTDTNTHTYSSKDQHNITLHTHSVFYILAFLFTAKVKKQTRKQ